MGSIRKEESYRRERYVGEVLSKNSSEEEKNNKLPNYEFSFQPLVIEREKEPISSYLLHRIKKDEDVSYANNCIHLHVQFFYIHAKQS